MTERPAKRWVVVRKNMLFKLLPEMVKLSSLLTYRGHARTGRKALIAQIHECQRLLDSFEEEIVEYTEKV